MDLVHELEIFHSGLQHLVEESQQVSQVQPEPAVQTPGVQAGTVQRVLPLEHHEPLALEAHHASTLWHGDRWESSEKTRPMRIHLIRFMMMAMHPASRPPPVMVSTKLVGLLQIGRASCRERV